jgi:rhodanese-related sulfurtransferase
MPDDITPEDLKARLDARAPVVLLDVREDWEMKLCRLDNSTHIPIEEIELRVDELSREDDIVVYCHHGVRSAAVADYLRQLGYARAVNLAGGVDEWARRIDPSMRRY